MKKETLFRLRKVLIGIYITYLAVYCGLDGGILQVEASMSEAGQTVDNEIEKIRFSDRRRAFLEEYEAKK